MKDSFKIIYLGKCENPYLEPSDDSDVLSGKYRDTYLEPSDDKSLTWEVQDCLSKTQGKKYYYGSV